MHYSPRKNKILEYANRTDPDRDAWISRNRYFHKEDIRYMKFLIPEGLRVLDLGCGTGNLLDALKPDFGVGVDFSPLMIKEARSKFPEHTYIHGDIEDPEIM